MRIARSSRLSSVEPDQAAKLVVVTGTPLSDCGAVSARGLLGIEKMFDALGAPMKGDRVEIVVDGRNAGGSAG